MDFGTNLKQLRKEKNLTQEELAECLSVSPQTVSKWENNITMPDLSVLPVLADYFGTTVDILIRHDINHEKSELKDLGKSVHALANKGKLDEAHKLLKDSKGKWALSASMNHLMSATLYQLSKEKESNERQELLEEAIMYADRAIRLDGGETSRTAQAKMTKCFCMYDLGRKAEAIRIAGTLPSMYSSRERVLVKVTEGAERNDYIRLALQFLDEFHEEMAQNLAI